MAEKVEPSYQSGADALAGWRDDLLSGKAPILYPVGIGALESIAVGPGLVLLLGGAPGAGKTALVGQWMFDALRLTPTLRAAVANVEMPPRALLDRQLARLSGVDLTLIRRRQLSAEHGERIGKGLDTLAPLAERLCFVRPPFDLMNIAATADAFGAGLMVLDYLQRIAPPGKHRDARQSVNSTMDFLRQFADAGTAIIAVAAVGRTKDSKGRSSYDVNGLGLASFRESSELEYGADSVYLLVPDGLRCVRDRNGEPRDIPLLFDRCRQRFTTAEEAPAPNPNTSKLNATLAALWANTAPADPDEKGRTNEQR